MAKVFANGMVAHVWAQRNQEDGKSHNGNFWFSGGSIYSYRTKIARFVTGMDGKNYCLLTTKSYSKTTEVKHKNAIRRAIEYDYFSVPFVEPTGGVDYHLANVDAYIANIRDMIAKAKRGSTDYLDSRVNSIVRMNTEMRNYISAFGLVTPGVDLDIESEIAAIHTHHVARAAKAADPKVIAAKARRAEAKAKDDSEKLDDWRAGRRRTAPIEMSAGGGAFVRIVGERLETSLGAVVPLVDAKRVFASVLACREAGREWRRNGDTIPVGQFQVDRIEPTGNFKAGCHYFEWSEVERAARSIGLIA